MKISRSGSRNPKAIPSFLRTNWSRHGRAWKTQEEKIREFKAQHVGELPSQLNSNLQILGGLQSQLQAESEALNTTKQQRVYLETLLSQYRALGGGSKDDKDDSTDRSLPSSMIAWTSSEPSCLSLSSTYGDKYPGGPQGERSDCKDRGGTEPAPGRPECQRQEGSVRRRHSRDCCSREAELKDPTSVAQLQSQLQANQVEIKNRERAIAASRRPESANIRRG